MLASIVLQQLKVQRTEKGASSVNNCQEEQAGLCAAMKQNEQMGWGLCTFSTSFCLWYNLMRWNTQASLN